MIDQGCIEAQRSLRLLLDISHRIRSASPPPTQYFAAVPCIFSHPFSYIYLARSCSPNAIIVRWASGVPLLNISITQFVGVLYIANKSNPVTIHGPYKTPQLNQQSTQETQNKSQEMKYRVPNNDRVVMMR